VSVGTGSDTSRWKQNYEKIILIAVLVGLMASAAYLFLRTEQVKKVLGNFRQFGGLNDNIFFN